MPDLLSTQKRYEITRLVMEGREQKAPGITEEKWLQNLAAIRQDGIGVTLSFNDLLGNRIPMGD